MRHLMAITGFVLVAAQIFVSGCESVDSLSSEEEDLLAKAKQAATVCDFGSFEITFGEVYAVSIQNKDLKTDKQYLVEVVLGGSSQLPAGQVKTAGTMLVNLKPWVAGAGTISVYETKTKKDKVSKTLKAQCGFQVKTNDQCPVDPNKTAPGLCGCGVADTDSDKDGTPNCKDGCPNDPLKLASGECGCGVPEGTCGNDDDTSNDQCPNDPNKTQPGECGCGVPEGTCGNDDDTPERWCIGEDTNEPPEPSNSGRCDICGGRELKSQNWSNNGPCLQAWAKVASTSPDSPECLAVIEEKRDFCCAGFYESPVRKQCTQEMGPYEPVDLCDDGCFPSHPATAGVYSLQAGGPLAPWVKALGDRGGTCYQDDGYSPNALVWTCRRAYYLLKYGHVPAAQANEIISWWSGHHALSANCGCDAKNTNNPAN